MQRGNNDWYCPSCSDKVFGSKGVCRCGQVRDASTMKPGDWICPSCSGYCFGSKDQCGKCFTAKPRANNVPQQQPRQQQASPMQKPGDWYCPGCNGLVFASKDRCRCGTSKPNANQFANSVNQPLTNSTNPFSAYVSVDVNYNNNVQGFPSTNPFGGVANLGQSVGGVNTNNTNNVNMNGGGGVKPGDWRCSACNENNFASRTSCFKCRASKPGANNVNMNVPQQQAPQSQQNKFAGDWNCSCGASNFGSRVVCYKCSAARPDANANKKDEADNDEEG
eukprot:TRINITY_DN1976_c0_g1_i2.p1 TRINITY_DN1976_c0_g1~~TRINITY_DN1976_c0_g1_i2.p1  ORF type:complete len:278 (-),score=25.86 TRINITY_DN1976_c0_g1_i2:478-1311(-)